MCLCYFYLVICNIIILLQRQRIMSQAQHAQPHEQDDCQGCQRQRGQNNRLIDFYERLHKIKTKVNEIKPSLSNHCNASKQQRSKLQKISNKIIEPPPLNNQMNELDSKQMGYQLACALLQRQIKMKKQNEMLANKIKMLKQLRNSQQYQFKNSQSFRASFGKKDSEMQSQIYGDMSSSKIHNNNQSPHLRTKKSKSLYSDSLDSALEDKSKSFWGIHNQSPSLLSQREPKQQNSRYSGFSIKDSQKDSSTFSSFEETGRTIFSPIIVSQEQSSKKFENLNLWLYQYQGEEDLYGKEKHNNIQSNSRRKSKIYTKK